jgi:hypothetical protein
MERPSNLENRVDKIEKHMEKLEREFDSGFQSIRSTLEEVKKAMVGSLDGENEGMVNRVRDVEAELAVFSAAIKELKSQNADTEKKKWVFGLLVTGGLFIFWKVADWIMIAITKN